MAVQSNDYYSEVVNPLGVVLDAVDTLNQPGVAVATIDLSQRFREIWLGDWRDLSNKERRTSVYSIGTEPPPPPPGDQTPPAVTIQSPAQGATVSGPTTVSASASDNVGVTRVRFFVDSTQLLGDDVSTPYSAAWDTRTATNGAHTLTATAFDAAGNSASSSITVTVANGTTPPGSTPFTGTPVTLPGRVEAENFDNGGADVAYRDLSPGNLGGAYRSTDVDLEGTTDTGGGYNVGWMAAGEWLVYSVTVPTAGTYRLDLRVAASGAGGRVHVEFDGIDKTGPMTIPDTGGWQAWTTISAPVTLAAGPQRMRLVVDAASSAGVVGNVNFVSVASTSTSQPDEIVLYASDVAATNLHGAWSKTTDSTSPGSVKLSTTNNGVAHTSAPLASPVHYVDVTFTPVAGTPYRLWLRLKALNNDKANDAVWVQFSGARANNAAIYPLNSTSGQLVNLATDSTASSLMNWGWQNGAYWLSQVTTFTFVEGAQTMRIQVREDGVQIDQIVLSPAAFLNDPPGGPTNDTTIVPKP
jgi:hypothetical protein